MKAKNLIKSLFVIVLVIFTLTTLAVCSYAETTNSNNADLDLTNNTKTIDQNYSITSQAGAYTDVTKVKLEWTVNEITATRKEAKVWDSENLKWVDDDNKDVVDVDPVTATFKITNYSSVKVDAKVEFEAGEYETGKKFSPAVEYTGVDATSHKTTLDTVVGENHAVEENPTAPSKTVTVKVTPDGAEFAKISATNSAKKYGTYTITISPVEEMVTITFVSSTSKATLSYDKKDYATGESFKIDVPKNSVISIVSTGTVGAGPTESTLTVGGKTVSQYSATGYPIVWFPVSNGTIITENTTINTSSCILSGTQVTLADGTSKVIDDVTTEDELMTFNFYEGKLDHNYPMFVMKHENVLSGVITVTLDNGTVLEMCDWQQFFDMDEKNYFDIDTANYKDVIGKNIMFIENGTVSTANISSATMEVRTCTSYEIFTEYNKNFIANGILTVEPETYLQGVYTIGDDLKIDKEQYEKDVSTYGRYTYEEFAEIMTKYEFDVMNIADKKIATGKGIVSEKWLFDLYREWTPLYR